jgi:hypothetical protein
LSNSLGHEPHDPYARYGLPGLFDVVVMSDECHLRKPDPAIFQLTLDQLDLPASACVFADDTEANLVTAETMGMEVVHALDEHETAARLRELLGLARRLPYFIESSAPFTTCAKRPGKASAPGWPLHLLVHGRPGTGRFGRTACCPSLGRLPAPSASVALSYPDEQGRSLWPG